MSGAELTALRAQDSQAKDSQVKDSQARDRQAPDSEAPDSQAPDSQAPDSEAPDSQVHGMDIPVMEGRGRVAWVAPRPQVRRLRQLPAGQISARSRRGHALGGAAPPRPSDVD
ncbi:hypothetical protein HEK616_75930 (plasmid) [Streptomyces nigrescens]|uniref:Uncharacterized protein n=1 Tax=Streptomyces nigrescens TaxID=1920 RepID=A0ABM8A631_STRNI|nr:hypothetical protein HEK616_75930 [Streptomyces nigrescens]